MLCLSTNVVLLITGEKKLGKVITPDTWKDGARNTTGNVSTQIKWNFGFVGKV